MSTLDTRDPSIFPISGYGRLLRPAVMPRVSQLVGALPSQLNDLHPAISQAVHVLSLSPAINTVGPEFGKRLRDGSYAKLIFHCEVLVEGEPYQVAVVIHLDDDSRNGLCYAEREDDPTPLCTIRFDAFMRVLIDALQEVVGTSV